MRIIFLALIAFSTLSLDAQTITVYVKDRAPVGPVDLSRGMAKAAELLCPAGVQIRWHRGEPNSQNPDFGRLIRSGSFPAFPVVSARKSWPLHRHTREFISRFSMIVYLR